MNKTCKKWSVDNIDERLNWDVVEFVYLKQIVMYKLHLDSVNKKSFELLDVCGSMRRDSKSYNLAIQYV